MSTSAVRGGELFARPPIGQPTAAYFPATGHEEALARLLYLAEYGRAGGLMVGPRGVGKSFLFAEATRELRSGLRTVLAVDMGGLDRPAVIERILAACRLTPIDGESVAAAEARIRSFLSGQQLVGQPIVFLLDHLDDADACGVRQMDRIVRLTDRSLGSVTVLAAASDVASAKAFDWLNRHGELRVEIPALADEEVRGFLADAAERAGVMPFSDSAADRLAEQSCGVPREIIRLARLAVLAAEAEELDEVSVDIVNSVANEVPSIAHEPRIPSL